MSTGQSLRFQAKVLERAPLKIIGRGTKQAAIFVLKVVPKLQPSAESPGRLVETQIVS